MPADVSLPQRPQVLGPEEQNGSCEVSRSSRVSSPAREGRHRKQQVLDSLSQRYYSAIKRNEPLRQEPTACRNPKTPDIKEDTVMIPFL